MKKCIVCVAVFATVCCLPAIANTLQDEPKPANYQVMNDKEKMKQINNDANAKVNNAMSIIDAKAREAQQKQQEKEKEKQQNQQQNQQKKGQ